MLLERPTSTTLPASWRRRRRDKERVVRALKFGIFLPTQDFAKTQATALSAEEQGYYSG